MGIGASEDRDPAALVIFVKKDTAKICAEFLSRMDGVPVRLVESGGFRAL